MISYRPNFGTWSVNVQPLLKEVEGRSEQVIWLLVGAGSLVLLVACANIAGLSVARAVARRKELALRHALGASRWQLARIGPAENLLIGLAGAAAGLAPAWAGMPLLRQLLPADFPRAHEIELNWLAALFAAGIALLTGVVAGLLCAGSLFLLRSYQQTGARDHGFNPTGVLTFRTTIPAGMRAAPRGARSPLGQRYHESAVEQVRRELRLHRGRSR